MRPCDLSDTVVKRPSIHVDRSHEWMFAYDDLAKDILVPEGYDVILSDASLGTENFQQCSIVMLLQVGMPSAFPDEEERLLNEYVRRGGHLLLITKPEASAERLVEAWAGHIRGPGDGPLCPTSELTSYGSPQSVDMKRVPFTLQHKENQVVLVRDVKSRPVVAATHVGLGTVVVWPDDYKYWDLCANRGNPELGNMQQLILAIFKWLFGSNRPGGHGTKTWHPGDIEVIRGQVIFRHSSPNKTEAMKVIKLFSEITPLVEKHNQLPLPVEGRFVVNLVSNSSGWAGNEEIGLGVYGELSEITKTAAHELTHITAGPWPTAFNEAWAIEVGCRVAEDSNYDVSARQERQTRLEFGDPQKHNWGSLDPTGFDCDSRELDPLYTNTAFWILNDIEQYYGKGFIPRFLGLKCQKYGRSQRLCMKQMLQLFAEIAKGANIYNRYHSLGIRW